MKKTAKALSLALVLILTLSLFAAAAGGNGSGGTGGGKELPTLQSSSVANGAADVPVNLANIVLQFTNNVVNMTVKDSNIGCFTLKDSSGKAVAISVEMGDDQVDPSIKEIVTIKLNETLKAGETYTLTVSGSLKAKNGNTMGTDATVSFTTAKAAPAAEVPATSPEPKPVVISAETSSGSEALPAAGGNDGILFAVLGFAALFIICGVILKKKQSN